MRQEPGSTLLAQAPAMLQDSVVQESPSSQSTANWQQSGKISRSSMAASTMEPPPSSDAMKRSLTSDVGAMKSETRKRCRNQPPDASEPVGPTTSSSIQV